MSLGILLIEDNPSDAELVVRSLRRHNLADSIRVIEDGEEALEYAFGTGRHAGRNASILSRVILLDIKLPKVDGVEVLKRIKADPRTRNTPVVMLTSSNQEYDRNRCYDLGANSYVVKPVEFSELDATVRECAQYWLALNAPPV